MILVAEHQTGVYLTRIYSTQHLKIEFANHSLFHVRFAPPKAFLPQETLGPYDTIRNLEIFLKVRPT